jgi:LmbE family N-acetylglucosaminyl deacetylase
MAKPKPNSGHRVALAIGAHPDDIEFQMAGTLVLLRRAGWETHYLNISTGNCGSTEFGPARTRVVRRKEARDAARILDARWHPPLCDDLEIFYDLRTLRRLAFMIRQIRPTIVLTHSPVDYMEDHTNTCRLVVTAAFTHGMPNFRVVPARATYSADVTVYHCMPHGLRDPLRRRVIPATFVNTGPVHAIKMDSLAAHRSQQGWLGASQGMNSYLKTMDDMSRELGRLSKRFRHAEGFRRHLHLGFSSTDSDPLAAALGRNYMINREYETLAKKGN